MFLNKQTFTEWLDEYFNKKNNQLSVSVERPVKRVQKIVLDLGKGKLQQPYRVPFSFKSIIYSSVYNKDNPQDYTDSDIYFSIDDENIMNLSNKIAMRSKDKLSFKNQVANCYLTWPVYDTAISPKAILYFLVDGEITTGKVLASIDNVVSVNVNNTVSASIDNISLGLNPLPVVLQPQNQTIKAYTSPDKPVLIENYWINSAATSSITGNITYESAEITVFLFAHSAAGKCSLEINGLQMMYIENQQVFSQTYYLNQGESWKIIVAHDDCVGSIQVRSYVGI